MVQREVSRFRTRVLGYSRRLVREEFAAIDSEYLEARRRRDELRARIEHVAEELDSAYATLREYERLHAENPSREPVACFVRYTSYVATSTARSIEEEGRDKAAAVLARGEEEVAARSRELREADQEGLRRLREAAARAEQLVDTTSREFSDLAAKVAGGRTALEEWMRGTAL
jgi:hypothetical protein